MAQKLARAAVRLASQTGTGPLKARAGRDAVCLAEQDMLGVSQVALLHCFRSFHSSASLLESLNVQVPSMGDSISEGTIAAVLKQQGDAVSEDETILQIDTDKVTIDVRAPKTGKVEAVLVRLLLMCSCVSAGSAFPS